MEPTIIHNDTCPICKREVAHYSRVAEKAGIHLDIQGLDGPARHALGLEREDAAQRFHVLHHGQLYSGLDAFAIIWERLPGFRWLARCARFRPVRAIATPVYDRILAPLLYTMHKRRVRKQSG